MGSGYHSQWGQTPLIGSDPIIVLHERRLSCRTGGPAHASDDVENPAERYEEHGDPDEDGVGIPLVS